MKLILAIAALLLAGTANSQEAGEDITVSADGCTHSITDDNDNYTEEMLEEIGQTQEEADLTESTLGTSDVSEEEAECDPSR